MRDIYDNHDALLEQHSIPRIDIADDDQRKWKTVLDALQQARTAIATQNDNSRQKQRQHQQQQRVVDAAQRCLSKLPWPSQSQAATTAVNDDEVGSGGDGGDHISINGNTNTNTNRSAVDFTATRLVPHLAQEQLALFERYAD